MKTSSLWRRLGLIVALLLMALALTGLAAPYLVDVSLKFDLLAHFRLHWYGLLGAAIAAIVLRRFWFPVIVIGLCVTPVMVGLLPAHRTSGEIDAAVAGDGEIPLKLVTFNAYHGNDAPEAVEAYLREEAADIVLLMEVGRSTLPVIERLVDMYPHRRDCVNISYCHIAILSMHPFEASEAREDWLGPPFVWVRLGEKFANLTVLGTHLTRIPYLDKQLREIRELAGESLRLGDPMIVAGDFNATQWSVMVNSFQEFSGLGRVTDAPTWPNWFFGLPQLAIDHIFISNGIVLRDRPRRGGDLGSDHRPISLELSVLEPE